MKFHFFPTVLRFISLIVLIALDNVLLAQTTEKSVVYPEITSAPPERDRGAEGELFALINQERQQSGVSLLQMDSTFSTAAHAHALAMAQHGEVSHQLTGEPSLAQRLSSSSVHLDKVGENIFCRQNWHKVRAAD